MTPSDSPWWDVVMRFVLAFGVLVIVFALVLFIVVSARLVGAWRDQKRRQRRPFQKNRYWRDSKK